MAIRLASAVYLAGLLHLYARRKKSFGFFLLMAISYALLFGLPCVAWVLSNPLNDTGQINFLLGLLSCGNLLTVLSHCESYYKQNKYVPFAFESNGAFVVVFVVVALAQAYKLYAYFGVLSSSEYGHLAIWVDGEALLSTVPTWIRVISGGSLLTGIIGVALLRNRPYMQFACLILITSDIIIGVRNKGFFGVLAAIYILSLFERDRAAKLFLRISSPFWLVAVFLALSMVSFLREGFEVPVSEYLLIVLDSLASIVNGLLTVASQSQCIDNLDGSLVFSQFWTLIGLRGGAQLSGEFNYCLTGDPSPLTSVSSSLIFEVLLLTGSFWPLAAGLYLVVLYAALRLLERHKSIFSLSLLCALAPAILYTLRAELLQPLVFILKSLPYILLIGLMVKRVSRKSPMGPAPAELNVGAPQN
ncbi:hypothetical protein C7444_105165 [Sphaerotilus hippei]|uniref:Uncharacterized protein n=1 Tax=Sphaerotilus hippei TaxID=744406 RepID=A0A318H4T6_9BURK|nr:hypothetical protein [Sphaerotilus hippei]PXW97066.1 hypothetical protein C7444_105165 [Sphaerotilus hippei]